MNFSKILSIFVFVFFAGVHGKEHHFDLEMQDNLDLLLDQANDDVILDLEDAFIAQIVGFINAIRPLEDLTEEERNSNICLCELYVGTIDLIEFINGSDYDNLIQDQVAHIKRTAENLKRQYLEQLMFLYEQNEQRFFKDLFKTAITLNYIYALDLFLQINDLFLTLSNADMCELLDFATATLSKSGLKKIMSYLEKARFDIRPFLNNRDDRGYTLLDRFFINNYNIWASRNERLSVFEKILKLLVKAGAEVNGILPANNRDDNELLKTSYRQYHSYIMFGFNN